MLLSNIDSKDKLITYQSQLLQQKEQNLISQEEFEKTNQKAKDFFRKNTSKYNNIKTTISKKKSSPLSKKERTTKEKSSDTSPQKTKKDKSVPSNQTDLELIEDGAFIPFAPYWNIIRFNYKFNKIMFKTYTALCYFAKNNKGMVKNVTTMDIADFLEYKSDSKIVKALKKLEQLQLIMVDRNSYTINTYYISGFTNAFQKGSKGGFVVPQKLIKTMLGFNLKYYRLVFYLLALRHHMPTNKNKTGIKQNTLKKITNSISFVELRNIIKDLVGVLFDKIYNFFTKIKRSLKGAKRLLFKFKELTIGIGQNKISKEEKEEMKRNPNYDNIQKVFEKLNIKNNWTNIKKGLNKIQNINQDCFEEIIALSKLNSIKSKWGTIKCFSGLVDKVTEALSAT